MKSKIQRELNNYRAVHVLFDCSENVNPMLHPLLTFIFTSFQMHLNSTILHLACSDSDDQEERAEKQGRIVKLSHLICEQITMC